MKRRIEESTVIAVACCTLVVGFALGVLVDGAKMFKQEPASYGVAMDLCVPGHCFQTVWDERWPSRIQCNDALPWIRVALPDRLIIGDIQCLRMG